ncbi:hypothetical protein TeGR_g14745, partial [Tetraparma gracilis]
YAPPKTGVAVDVPLFEGGRVQLGRAPPEKPSPDFVAGSAVMGPDSCRLNAESFAECGDRGRAWKLLGLLSPSSPAIREAARYYQRGGDYQMCALVAAVFGLKGFDGEVRRYAEALYAWGFLGARLELLKRTGAGSEEMGGVGIGIGTLCSGCGEEKEKGEFCKSCRVFKSRCSICNFRVRGAATACLDCTHGGCLGCMEQWFKEHDECPTGCGCRCKERQFVGKERDGGEAAGGGWKDGRPVPVVRRAGGEEEDVKKKVEMSEKEERKMPSLREMRGRDAIGLGWGS